MSSSKSSCSSIRNPYGTSSNNYFMSNKNHDSDFEYRFNGIKYKCDLVAPCQEAWREGTMDPGRRFFGCSQYKASLLFKFVFIPDYRAREVVEALKAKLRAKDEELQRATIELRFVEKKMLVLNEERVSLRKKIDELSGLVHKEKDGRSGSKMKKLLLIIVIVWFVVGFFK
ncbi:GRF-type domain-containing protein [Heracleum sosnowskyi]|uniref:GRF-type domain-containing protein n=1 Tax=Heracleum sosnowskyi TaxID=360622 RepID=A0AAD8J852_9APIA|nr:GRF-type domain-containing protein [Heracleum sosnowskyi]